MTRFWISLQQGVDFVLKNFDRMYGGEIFVPKIPSIRIVDLAQAMASHLPRKVVGIRPGEKLHEVMCPSDDSHLTIEFGDHFVITPSIRFNSSPNDNNFRRNALGEVGRDVAAGFEYQSGSNPNFLSVTQIAEFNRSALT
jgi:UDP-N-acetylglucosamine 4,6-dehydratase